MPGDPLFQTLNELRFFFDKELEPITGKNVRELLRLCGVKTGQDIVDLGCTGLMKAGMVACASDVIKIAQFIRDHMTGAGIGLPCYIPPTRFCLIHEIVGGLQDKQLARHPVMQPFCSRKLTKEERKHATAVNALRSQEGARAAVELYDAEVVSSAQTEGFWDRIVRWMRKLFRRS